MRRRILSSIPIVAAAVGLGASLASLVDMLGPAPAFCSDSGCATVRASAWAHPLGIPLPVLGVAYFGVMLALCGSAATVRRVLAIAGGASAIALIGIQAFAIGAWCKLCLVADVAAIAG